MLFYSSLAKSIPLSYGVPFTLFFLYTIMSLYIVASIEALLGGGGGKPKNRKTYNSLLLSHITIQPLTPLVDLTTNSRRITSHKHEEDIYRLHHKSVLGQLFSLSDTKVMA